MRTSILSRSVIAVATLAIGSVALAAVPASAATSTGVTRSMVLTATHGVRAAVAASPSANYSTYPEATRTAVRQIINRSCGTDPDAGEAIIYAGADTTQAGDDADGLLIFGVIGSYTESEDSIRFCLVGASAASAPATTLAGRGTLNLTYSDAPAGAVTTAAAPVTVTTSLSGDVSTSVKRLTNAQLNQLNTASYNATGKATTTTKVADKKTKAEKKAAKKAYSKRLASAKKSYEKALKKAGSSKTKKAAAKKAYSAKKKAAKAKYSTAIAPFKLVKKSAPFNITASDSNSDL